MYNYCATNRDNDLLSADLHERGRRVLKDFARGGCG